MITQIEAKRKLAASIRNERRNYDQEQFVIGGNGCSLATCGTAACIAGHIEACWPQVARRLAQEERFHPSCRCCRDRIYHDDLAAAIWQEVTGKPCRFDFGIGPHENVTREEAVAHIYGRNKQWPLRRQENA